MLGGVPGKPFSVHPVWLRLHTLGVGLRLRSDVSILDSRNDLRPVNISRPQSLGWCHFRAVATSQAMTPRWYGISFAARLLPHQPELTHRRLHPAYRKVAGLVDHPALGVSPGNVLHPGAANGSQIVICGPCDPLKIDLEILRKRRSLRAGGR